MERTTYQPKYDDHWALVIGINEYQHGSPLGYASNDASVFAETLDKFGFPKSNIVLLLDKDATLNGIRREMHKLAKKTGDDDRIVVFYAGHGLTLPAYGREAGFLVPVDGKADDTSTLLPWDDLANTSRLIRAKHMLFIMDACYGGLIGMRGLAPGTKRFVRDMLSRYSRQFLTAGKADQVVADSGGPRMGHSVFTGHLLDALEGGLHPQDGIVSANALMAHVYDRVAKDPHSLQAPHYGFLAGDGDLFFTIPQIDTDASKPKDTDDVLVQVPPDLIAPEEVTVDTPVVEQVKEYLPDPRYRIKLDDLVKRQVRIAQQRLGEEGFSVHASKISGEDFAARLEQYEEAISDLLNISMLLGRWSETEQQAVLQQIVHALAGNIEPKGGSVLWLALRWYPMLLVMYAGGIAAIDSSNYLSLHTLFTTQIRQDRRGEPSTVLQGTVEAMLDVNRTDAFKLIPGLEQKYTPSSEYLFMRLQSILEDQLVLGSRYEDLFDRFEVLYALCYSDLSGRGWGHPGRFAWKYVGGSPSSNPFGDLLEEAKRDGDNWSPLRAGLFRGSYEHFAKVAEQFKSELLDHLPWH